MHFNVGIHEYLRFLISKRARKCYRYFNRGIITNKFIIFFTTKKKLKNDALHYDCYHSINSNFRNKMLSIWANFMLRLSYHEDIEKLKKNDKTLTLPICFQTDIYVRSWNSCNKHVLWTNLWLSLRVHFWMDKWWETMDAYKTSIWKSSFSSKCGK